MKDLLTPGEWARLKAHHYDRKVEEMKAAQGVEDVPHEYDTDDSYAYEDGASYDGGRS